MNIQTSNGLKVGMQVQTPAGIGRVHAIQIETVDVEVDFTYLVRFPISQVKPLNGRHGC